MQDLLRKIDRAVESRDAAGIAAGVNRLIADGHLAAGSRVPTVRAIARQLRVSPTTVSEAWQALLQFGTIETRGRNGTFVVGHRAPAAPRRFWTLAQAAGHFEIDLSAGVPDPALLPNPGPSLSRVAGVPRLTSYLDDPVLPELERVVRKGWEKLFEPEALTVVDGALDALDRLLGVLTKPGDRVAVEEPCFPPVFDLLDAYGVGAVPVALTSTGVDIPALSQSIERHRPTVLILQPRAQNPTGISMTPAHARRLASALRPHGSLTIIEDDHSGDISSSPEVTLAAHLPDRVLHVKSFSKSHGPDLRLAVVAGPKEPIDALAARRRLGASWSSRILQGVLVDLLEDREAKLAVIRARMIYAERRRDLVAELKRRGVDTTGTDGINLWTAVERERDALVMLAAQGIGVAPGTPFFARADTALATPHIRITCASMDRDVDKLADRLAAAARPGSPSGMQ